MTAPDNIVKGDPFRRAYGTLSESQKLAMDLLKVRFEHVWMLFMELEDMFGKGRDIAIAKTKLQDSCMWAGRAITKTDYQE